MPNVIVDHTGSCRDSEGKAYHYIMGKVINLPGDVVKALGNAAKAVEKAATDGDKTPYNDLLKKAKELGLNPAGKKYDEVVAMIAEAEKAAGEPDEGNPENEGSEDEEKGTEEAPEDKMVKTGEAVTK